MVVVAEVKVQVEIPNEVWARLVAVGGEARVVDPVVVVEPPAPAGTVVLDQAVRRLVEERAPKADAARYLEFLERCVAELGAQPVVPKTGDRPNVNVNPPARRRGARLAVLNVSSGRLAFNGLPPGELSRWAGAEVVEINGTPSHLKVYLAGDAQVEVGLEMVQAVLDRR